MPLPLTQSMSSHSSHGPKSRDLGTPDTSPHAHAHAAHALGHAPQQHAHAPQGSHAHAQYPLGLGGAPFLSNPSLFNIKSEPASGNAASYDTYPPHSAPHYHSQQHYLHALQVSSQ